MESNQGGGSPPPTVTTRRSRTRRDPAEDHVYSVPPQDFARTVQKLTSGAPAAVRRRTPSPPPLPPPPDLQPSAPPPPPPLALSVSTTTASSSRSMQDAYLAWCASNNVILSPGTMAEMDCLELDPEFRR